MERADLALQLHAKLVPLLKASGQERVFSGNRIAAAAGAGGNGK